MQTVKYLENTPCVRQTPEIIAKYNKEVEKFNLTKPEKLLLINLRPTTAVEIQLVLRTTIQMESITNCYIYPNRSSKTVKRDWQMNKLRN